MIASLKTGPLGGHKWAPVAPVLRLLLVHGFHVVSHHLLGRTLERAQRTLVLAGLMGRSHVFPQLGKRGPLVGTLVTGKSFLGVLRGHVHGQIELVVSLVWAKFALVLPTTAMTRTQLFIPVCTAVLLGKIAKLLSSATFQDGHIVSTGRQRPMLLLVVQSERVSTETDISAQLTRMTAYGVD